MTQRADNGIPASPSPGQSEASHRLAQDDRTAVERMARAICKSKTCEGFACCQWPANMGRTNCPVKNGGYDDAAIAALSASAAPGVGWQPIETAPRDGTHILCWLPGYSACEILYASAEGWCMANGYYLKGTADPTHWQPLPAPPALTATPAPGMVCVPMGWTVGGLRQDDSKRWWCELREGYQTSYARVVITKTGSPTLFDALAQAAEMVAALASQAKGRE